MSDFHADGSRWDGGRLLGASSQMSCDLDAVVPGDIAAFGLVTVLYQLAEDGRGNRFGNSCELEG